MKKIVSKTSDSKGATSYSFKAERKENYAPKIVSELDGIYTLDNGRKQTVESYNALWHPLRSNVLPKGTKDDMPLLSTVQKRHY